MGRRLAEPEGKEMGCPQCGGSGFILGQLGRKKWFRCGDCGADFSSNPSGMTALREINEKTMPLIYGKVLKIFTQKTGEEPDSANFKGEKFYHNFHASDRIYGVPGGSKLILPDGTEVALEKRCLVMISGHDLWNWFV
jgi:hypothetical protein